MKRFFVGCLLILSLSVSVFWFVRLRPIHRSFYTDADAIKTPVAQAPLREVLWQPAAPVRNGNAEQVDEYEPRVSADGSRLFFVRGKAGENADLFVADRNGADWSDPRAIEGVNSDADDLGPEPSADGNTLYFYSNRDGGLGGYDLWIARRSNDRWELPTPLPSPVNSPYNDYGPALSPDGRTLYFASNRPVEPNPRDPFRDSSIDEKYDRWSATLREDLTVRTYDLYAAQVTDDGILAPTPIVTLNTPFNEGAPAVSGFGDFLYFASDRPGGRGAFDLYRSRRIRDEFRVPDNLGDAVNTPANDLDPALGMGGYRLYFSSDRARTGGSELPRNRYELYVSTSREVFRDWEVEQRPPVAWAAIWRVLAPWLLLAILALLGLLTLLALVKTFREKRVSLLTKCLLGSLLAHLALMFLFTVWNVTASIAEGIRGGGEIRISLGAGGAVDALFAQLQGRATDANLPTAERSTIRPQAPVALPAAPSVLQMSLASVTLANIDDQTSVEPTVQELPPRDPALRRFANPSFAPPTEHSALPIHAPRVEAPTAADEPLVALTARDVRATPRPQRGVDFQPSQSRELVAPTAISDVLPLETTSTDFRPTDPPASSRPIARASATPARTSDMGAPPATPFALDSFRTVKVDVPLDRDEPLIEPLTVAQARQGSSVRPSSAPTLSGDVIPGAPSVHFAVGPVNVALDAPPSSQSPSSLTEAPTERRAAIVRTPPALDPTPTSDAATALAADTLRLPVSESGSARVSDVDEPLVRVPSVDASPLRPTRPPAQVGSKTSGAGEPSAEPAIARISVGPLAATDVTPFDEESIEINRSPTAPSEHAARTGAHARSRAPSPEKLDPAMLSLRTDPITGPTTPDSIAADRSVATESEPALPRAVDAAAASNFRPATRAEVPSASSPVEFRSSLPSGIGAVAFDATPTVVPERPVGDRGSHAQRGRGALPKPAPSALPMLALDLRALQSSQDARSAASAALDLRPDPPDNATSDAPIGTIVGTVTDAGSGATLPGSVIRLEILDAHALTATANERGEYTLVVPSMPDDFALSASMIGYAPSAANVRSSAVEKGRLEVNFSLHKLSEEVVVTEADPELHHLGDDVFDGDINSQFQKSSEGTGFETRFDLSERQISPYVGQAEVRMLVKGVQRRHGLVINGTLLEKRLSKAPRDGGFGEFIAPIDPALLRIGENTFRILCAPPVDSDYDDFEFVNVQIHLVLGVH